MDIIFYWPRWPSSLSRQLKKTYSFSIWLIAKPYSPPWRLSGSDEQAVVGLAANMNIANIV
jgi:hypothetical protein